MVTRRTTKETPLPDNISEGMPRGADPEAWRLMVNGGGADVADPDEVAEDDIGTRLRAAFASAPGEHARVSLFRRSAYSKTREWCRDYTPDEFIDGGLQLVKTEFGAGSYEFRAFGNTGLITRGNFDIADTLKNNPAPIAAPAASNETAELLRAVLAKLATPAPPPPSLMQQLGINSLAEGLALASTLKGLFAPTAPAAPASDPMEAVMKAVSMIKALREQADEINPPAADPDNPMSLIPSFLDVIKTGMQQQGGAAPSTLPTLALPGSVASAPAVVPKPAAPDSNGDEISRIMGEVETMLKQGRPADDIGDFLYEYLPDEAFDLFKLPNWLDLLCAQAPQFTPHRNQLAVAHARIVTRQGAAG